MLASHRAEEIAGLIELSATGAIVSVDAGAETLLQRPRRELLDRSFAELCPLVQAEPLRNTIERARRTGAPGTCSCTHDDRLLEITVLPRSANLLLLVRDVTERRQREEASSWREAGYRALVEASAQFTWRADPDGKTVEFSPAWFAVTGMKPNESSERWPEVVHPDDRSEAIAAWAEARRLRVCYEFDLRIRCRGGSYRHFSTRSVPIFDEAGFLREWVGMATDIEDRRQAETERERLLRELAAEKHQLVEVLEALPAGVLLARPDGTIVLANRAIHDATRLQFAGRGPAEFDSYEGYRPDGERYHGDSWPLNRTLATGKAVEGEEFRYRRGDGSAGWLRVSTAVLHDEDGQLTGALLHAIDVTERKEMEQALRSSEDRLREITELIPQHVWRVSADWQELDYANLRCIEDLGLQRDELLAQRWMAAVHPDDARAISATVRDAFAHGAPYEVELRLRVGGEWRWFLVRGVPRRDEDGRIVRWFGTSTDVHELRTVREALERSEARFRRIAELNVLGMVTWRTDGTFVEANDEALRILGIDRSALPIRWLDHTAPETLPQSAAALREMQTVGSTRPFEKVYLRPDGSRVPVIVAAVRDSGASESGVAFLIDLERIERVVGHIVQPSEASSSARL